MTALLSSLLSTQIPYIQLYKLFVIMKHSMSPKITAIEVLMGNPPIEIYCSSIEIKFLIKAVNNDDLVNATHVKTECTPLI